MFGRIFHRLAPPLTLAQCLASKYLLTQECNFGPGTAVSWCHNGFLHVNYLDQDYYIRIPFLMSSSDVSNILIRSYSFKQSQKVCNLSFQYHIKFNIFSNKLWQSVEVIWVRLLPAMSVSYMDIISSCPCFSTSNISSCYWPGKAKKMVQAFRTLPTKWETTMKLWLLFLSQSNHSCNATSGVNQGWKSSLSSVTLLSIYFFKAWKLAHYYNYYFVKWFYVNGTIIFSDPLALIYPSIGSS